MPAETIRSKHQNTFLGNIWHLGNPLLTVAVYLVVFGGLLGANRGIDNYLLWLTVGVFAYRLTSASVLGGATAISSNQGLMRAIRFPRALLPISVVIGETFTFGFELGAMGVVALATGEGVSRRWLVLPVIVIGHSMLNLGGAFVAARLNDSFRDMQQIIPFLFRLLQFLSGVMYPIDRFADGGPGWLRRLVVWNPIVRILDLYRWAFMGTPIDVANTVTALLISAALLVFGFRFFVAAEHRYGRP
jgi:teichoic acid transport system permease protein